MEDANERAKSIITLIAVVEIVVTVAMVLA